MTEKIDTAAIRARYEAIDSDNPYKVFALARLQPNYDFFMGVIKDIPALLNENAELRDALEMETKRVDEAEAENEQWNDSDCNTCPLRNVECCEQICESKMSMLQVIFEQAKSIFEAEYKQTEIESDRDKWKIRAKALEKAMFHVAPEQNSNIHCPTCIHYDSCYNGNGKYKCNLNGEYPHWEFDEIRWK